MSGLYGSSREVTGAASGRRNAGRQKNQLSAA